MQPTNTGHAFAPVNMPSHQSVPYAASTYSEATTTTTAYSYDKAPTDKPFKKTKRSLKQRAKSFFKDIGTNPFEYEDENKHKQAAAFVATMPPSRI